MLGLNLNNPRSRAASSTRKSKPIVTFVDAEAFAHFKVLVPHYGWEELVSVFGKAIELGLNSLHDLSIQAKVKELSRSKDLVNFPLDGEHAFSTDDFRRNVDRKIRVGALTLALNLWCEEHRKTRSAKK